MLCVDYGERRIGLAVSDKEGLFAHGLPTLDRRETPDAVAAIAQLAAERGAAEIVVGLPRSLDGSLGPAAARVQEFARELEARAGLPVAFVDERLTTARAHALMKQAGLKRKQRAQKADRAAAQMMLQSYLDRRRAAGR